MDAGRKGLLRREQADTSPVVADEVKHTTCYMCACRCGIRVHLKDGKVRQRGYRLPIIYWVGEKNKIDIQCFH